jgi:CRISPR system Cascade subunit CasA
MEEPMTTTDTAYDLLREPLLPVQRQAGVRESVSLPDLLAALAHGDIAAIDGLQAHQTHSAHAFLVHLAALAVHRAGASLDRLDAEGWRAALLGLSGGERSAFCLVVPDLARPAFMQPPVPEGSLDGFKPELLPEPDLVDILLTAKNHEVKAGRARSARPSDWIWALVSLQTMQGYSGRSNYGIARMNGGLGNRPCVAFASTLEASGRFRDDVTALAEARAELVDQYGYRAAGGHELLWMVSWDGSGSLSGSDLDPLFIEVCRRVRLVMGGGLVAARMVSTELARVDLGERLGDVGDPWTPVERKTSKSLTLPAAGFSYQRVQALALSAEWQLGVCGRLRTGSSPGWFICWAIVRGQGKTEGLHERIVRIPPRVGRLLGSAASRDELASVSRAFVVAAGTMQKNVLAAALRALHQAGSPGRVDFKAFQVWVDRFDRAVDREFFDHLWQSTGQPVEVAVTAWVARLARHARTLLARAVGATPVPSVRRFRAESTMWRVFGGRLRKEFPDVATDLREDEWSGTVLDPMDTEVV